MHDQGSSALSGASAPTAITPQFIGQIYINTSTGLSYISNSLTTGDWNEQVLTTTSTLPKAADFSSWTWQNQGSATLTDGYLGGAALYIPQNATSSFRHLATAVPTAPYQVTAQFKYLGDLSSYRYGGIGWKSALTGAAPLEIFGYRVSTGGVGVGGQNWYHETSVHTHNSWRTNLAGYNFFVRIKESSGSIYLYYSENRNSWLLVNSYAKGTQDIGAGDYNYLVIGGNSYSTLQDVYFDITYFKVETL